MLLYSWTKIHGCFWCFGMNAKTQELEATVNTYVNHQINRCEEDESERYNAYLGDLARKIEPILVKFYGSQFALKKAQ